jgi:putative ABC transport system permease protein
MRMSMNRPRWRKVITDLWASRTRSLLVVASITVGLFAVGVIVILYQVISADMRNGYAAINPANVHLLAAPFNQDLVDTIRRVDGVRQVEGAALMKLRLEAWPGEWVAIDVKAVPKVEEMEINQLRLEDGRWPDNAREIVLERYKFADAHAAIGDTIALELPSGKTRQLELVGVVHDQSIGSSGLAAGFFLAPIQGYVNSDILEWLEQPDAFTNLFVTTTGDPGNTEEIFPLMERVRDQFENNGGVIRSTDVRSSYVHPNQTFVDAIVIVLLMLGLLVVFLSGFLITNTLQALLTQQVQQVGIMKTVGGRRAQIAGIYMALIFIFGVFAFLISMPLAYLVSFWLVDRLALEINFVSAGYRMVPVAVLIQLAIALVMPQVAAFIPIWQGSRLSVQEALSGLRHTKPPRRGLIDAIMMRFRGISRPLLISIRNTFRRKGRLLLTLATLTLGGAIFIATFNVQESLKNYTDGISRYFLADVNITVDRPHRLDKIEQILSTVPDVKRVEGWGAASVELTLEDGKVGERVHLLAPPVGSPLVNPILIKGRWIQPGDTNAITLSELFINQFPGLGLGDTLRLRVNAQETEWIVVGFFQLAGKSGGYLAYTGYDYLSELTGQVNRASLFRIEAVQPGLTRQQQENLGREVEAALNRNGVRVVEVTSGLSLSKTAADGFAVLTGFLLFLAVLTALVGSIGLAGTMSMNVMERTREIGVMRAIGATNSILMKMVIVEGIIIGLLSWMLGSLLSFPISSLLSNSISYALFDASTNFGFTPAGFSIWLGAVLVLSVLASVMPARTASRLTIREVLAFE